MTPYRANPFYFIFAIAVVCALCGYYVYEAIDRTGLEVTTSPATVEDKQFTESGKVYYTTIAGGRAWVESEETPETYAVVLDVNGDRTAGAVPKDLFDALNINDTVEAQVRRTRITRRLEVVHISR